MEIKLFKCIQSFVRFVYLSFVSECRRNKKNQAKKKSTKKTPQNKHTNNQNMRAFFMLFYRTDEELLRPDPR